MPSCASDRRRSWSVTTGVLTAVTLVYSAWHDCGGGRTANPRPRPRPRLRYPAPAPWQTHRTVGCQVPGGADKCAPGQGRLCPASSGIDHRPCSRPLWLSTTGLAWGGGVGGAMRVGGGGGKDGGCAGAGRRCDGPPPCVLVAVQRFLRRLRGSFIGNDGRQTNDNQKLTKGGFQ